MPPPASSGVTPADSSDPTALFPEIPLYSQTLLPILPAPACGGNNISFKLECAGRTACAEFVAGGIAPDDHLFS